ncbi:Translation initiation factor eIF-2B subunit gamma [Lecanora helva]
MPHATSMPYPGFQAIILCGPGLSLNTFTANPEDFPKALVPIANRPMVWYPMDWCYRMGITNIHLVTPPSSLQAIQTALAQNPHLTSLPAPKPDILAPLELLQNTPTAEVLRFPEVQAAITGDFLILPCDLVCELPGESLLEAWMIQQGSLGGSTYDLNGYNGSRGIVGERGGRRGGLGVWFETKGDDSTKGTETDFVITTRLPQPAAAPPANSLRPNISKLLYATTTDTLRDITEEKKGFPIRTGLIRKHGKIRMLTTHRDAHIYLLPHWVLEMIKQNEKLESMSEDVIGWWAKASWQDGLAEKLHLRQVLDPSSSAEEDGKDGETRSHVRSNHVEDEIDLASMSSTYISSTPERRSPPSASPKPKPQFTIPPILSYIHPTTTTSGKPTPLIRRVDTPHLLLHTSLHLASLAPTTDPATTAHSYAQKISSEASIAPHTNIYAPTTLIAPNTTVATHAVIKTTVIGANCEIGENVRLTGCLLMDGVVVKEKCVLQGCILGRRCHVGGESNLRECEVQEGFRVPEKTEGKGEKFMVSEGLELGGDVEEDGDVDVMGDEGTVE